LRECFIGSNCYTTMITQISPTEKHTNETLNTLRYASKIKNCNMIKRKLDTNNIINPYDVSSSDLTDNEMSLNNKDNKIESKKEYKNNKINKQESKSDLSDSNIRFKPQNKIKNKENNNYHSHKTNTVSTNNHVLKNNVNTQSNNNQQQNKKPSHIKNINIESNNVLDKNVLDYLDNKLINDNRLIIDNKINNDKIMSSYNEDSNNAKRRNSNIGYK